jgi:hypothetical protein
MSSPITTWSHRASGICWRLHKPKHDVSFVVFTGEIVNIFATEQPMHGLDIPFQSPGPFVRTDGLGKKFHAPCVQVELVGGSKKTVGS